MHTKTKENFCNFSDSFTLLHVACGVVCPQIIYSIACGLWLGMTTDHLLSGLWSGMTTVHLLFSSVQIWRLIISFVAYGQVWRQIGVEPPHFPLVCWRRPWPEGNSGGAEPTGATPDTSTKGRRREPLLLQSRLSQTAYEDNQGDPHCYWWVETTRVVLTVIIEQRQPQWFSMLLVSNAIVEHVTYCCRMII